MCRMLLSLTVVLGLVSGIAFSASYQLVARFANKNTISLGLGCVGSGIVTLAFQLALNMGATPTRKQEIILFELTAGADRSHLSHGRCVREGVIQQENALFRA